MKFVKSNNQIKKTKQKMKPQIIKMGDQPKRVIALNQERISILTITKERDARVSKSQGIRVRKEQVKLAQRKMSESLEKKLKSNNKKYNEQEVDKTLSHKK